MESSLKCRKCGGKHLTIKCGKDNESDNKELNNKTYNKELNNKTYNKELYNNEELSIRRNGDRKKFNKVKISNLPYDITLEELTELLENWGHITRVYVKNFNENSFAIIEFKFKDELDYFIEALNNTPFENQIINVQELDNY
jgi:RNA recognition motif-containing protein